MKVFLLLTLLFGYSTMYETVQAQEFVLVAAKTRYKVGDCGVLVDPETGRSNPNDIFKVEKIGSTHYVYRWWFPDQGWSVDVSSHPIVGKHEVLERISKECECPS